jgi:hypothetical protein
MRTTWRSSRALRGTRPVYFVAAGSESSTLLLVPTSEFHPPSTLNSYLHKLQLNVNFTPPSWFTNLPFSSPKCSTHYFLPPLSNYRSNLYLSPLKQKVKLSLYQDVKAHRVVRRRGSDIFSRQSAHRWQWGCQPYAPAALYPPGRFLLIISIRGWVEPRAIARLEN